MWDFGQELAVFIKDWSLGDLYNELQRLTPVCEWKCILFSACDSKERRRKPPYQAIWGKHVKTCVQKSRLLSNKCFFSTVDWDEVYVNCVSTEDYWSAFKDVINTAIFNCVPFVNVQQCNRKSTMVSSEARPLTCHQRKEVEEIH